MSSYILTQEGLREIKQRFEQLWNSQPNSERHKCKIPTKKWMASCSGIDSDTMHKVLARKKGVKPTTLHRICNGLGWELGIELQEKTHYELSSLSTQSTPKVTSQTIQTFTDWGDAPDVSHLNVRPQAVEQLKLLVTEQKCRLITLHGIAGIGKTFLASKLTETLIKDFDKVIWRTVTPNLSPHLLITEILRFLENDPQLTVSESLEIAIPKLIYSLSKHRCLVVIDDLQTILNDKRRCHHNYGLFLQKIAQGRHRSCFLLNSRTLPEEIIKILGKKVKAFQVKGLESDECTTLIKNEGLKNNSWKKQDLINAYQGHPLALKMAVHIIKNIHQGSITNFLEESFFLNNIIISILDEQFSRLSHLKQQLMILLASEFAPISIQEIFVKNPSFSKNHSSEITSHLYDLLQQSLISTMINDQQQSCFFLEPLIRKYVNIKAIPSSNL